MVRHSFSRMLSTAPPPTTKSHNLNRSKTNIDYLFSVEHSSSITFHHGRKLAVWVRRFVVRLAERHRSVLPVHWAACWSVRRYRASCWPKALYTYKGFAFSTQGTVERHAYMGCSYKGAVMHNCSVRCIKAGFWSRCAEPLKTQERKKNKIFPF